MYRRGTQQKRRAIILWVGFESCQMVFDGADQRFYVHSEINRSVGFELFQSGAPQFKRSGRYSLLQLEISGGDLNDRLVKFSIFAMILQPDLFQSLMTLEKQRLIEFFNTFEKSRIILRFHRRIT